MDGVGLNELLLGEDEDGVEDSEEDLDPLVEVDDEDPEDKLVEIGSTEKGKYPKKKLFTNSSNNACLFTQFIYRFFRMVATTAELPPTTVKNIFPRFYNCSSLKIRCQRSDSLRKILMLEDSSIIVERMSNAS